jgi:peptidoglycan/LPS O-acetylase OafA/YrhL
MNHSTHAASPLVFEGKSADSSLTSQIPGIGVHLPALDGIRGLAILMVMVFHVTQFLAILHVEIPFEGLRLLLLGQSGVDLFFVLSGFLITGILLDTRDAPGRFRKFYGRRTLRICPLYYGVILLGMFITFVTTGGIFRSDGIGWTWLATYLGNVPPTLGVKDAYFGHFWSLAVEEQFYLVWPTIIYLLPVRYSFAISAAMVVAGPCGRLAFEEAGLSSFYPTPCRTDALGIGAVLAFCLRNSALKARDRRLHALGWITSLAAMAGCVPVMGSIIFGGHEIAWVRILKFSAFAWVYAILIANATYCVSTSWLSRVLNFRFLRLAGKYSYAMYVFHPFIILALRNLLSIEGDTLSASGAICFGAVAIAVTFVIAQATWFCFELPLLSMKAYFAY